MQLFTLISIYYFQGVASSDLLSFLYTTFRGLLAVIYSQFHILLSGDFQQRPSLVSIYYFQGVAGSNLLSVLYTT